MTTKTTERSLPDLDLDETDLGGTLEPWSHPVQRQSPGSSPSFF